MSLRHERVSKGWTMQYVAERAGITKQSVYDLEVGRRNPSYKVVLALEDLFKKNHRELFQGHDE